MKFAMDLDGNRILPSKHGRGQCPFCNSQVIARCGNKRAHHWAHESLRDCEYSEYTHIHETPWHINWKNNFPIDWHEIILQASNGEKHISDVRTPNGLTIEFQHSPILEEERISREKFYKSIGGMIWVVDGTKNKIDWKRWCNSKLLREHISGVPDDVTISKSASTFLPVEWLHCDVPVFFDFIGTASTAEVIQETRELICILCNKSKTIHLFIPIEKDLFITLCHDGKIFKWIKAHLPTTQAPPPPQLFNGNSITSRTKPLSIRRNFYPRYHDRELDKIFGIVTPRQKFPKRRKRQSPPTKRKRRP